METLPELTTEIRLKAAQELILAAENGLDVSDADPRDSSIEAVVTANKIMRAQGKTAVRIVQSGL